ncbi:hypothetical protein C4565_04230 [Candidatus Parcubacteria bacterium]|jgi:hypothetical protein|nr:MAG: hypothetical protein C4565_04230 [Candidatus Parcubacteria bacterium]
MTDEKNNNMENAGSCCMFCKKGKMMCGPNGMHRACHIIRWVLGLLILWAVFMGGVKLGEFKSMIDTGDFGRSHRSGYGYQNNFRNSIPMMRNGGYNADFNCNQDGMIRGYGLKDGSGIQKWTIPDGSITPPEGKFLQ